MVGFLAIRDLSLNSTLLSVAPRWEWVTGIPIHHLESLILWMWIQWTPAWTIQYPAHTLSAFTVLSSCAQSGPSFLWTRCEHCEHVADPALERAPRFWPPPVDLNIGTVGLLWFVFTMAILHFQTQFMGMWPHGVLEFFRSATACCDYGGCPGPREEADLWRDDADRTADTLWPAMYFQRRGTLGSMPSTYMSIHLNMSSYAQLIAQLHVSNPSQSHFGRRNFGLLLAWFLEIPMASNHPNDHGKDVVPASTPPGVGFFLFGFVWEKKNAGYP